MVDLFRALARAAGPAVFPDGEHLALPQLQGSDPDRTALAAHRDLFRNTHLPYLELLPAGPSGALLAVRQHWHLHSSRRNYPTQVPRPSTIASSRASDQLTSTLIEQHHLMPTLHPPPLPSP